MKSQFLQLRQRLFEKSERKEQSALSLAVPYFRVERGEETGGMERGFLPSVGS